MSRPAIAFARTAGRGAEVVVDHQDVAEPKLARALRQFVLAPLTLEILLHLEHRRLTNIYDRTPIENTGGKVIALHRAPPFPRWLRRPRAGSRRVRAGSRPARSARLRKGRT